MAHCTTYEVLSGAKKFFDDRSYDDAINYVANPDKASFVGGVGVTSIKDAASEMKAVASKFEKENGKKLRHSVLSFRADDHVSPEKVNQYAKEIVQYYGPEYQIMYGVHTNTDNVHIHFVMNQISFQDGHRYQGKKKDYYDFRAHMSNVIHRPVILVKN